MARIRPTGPLTARQAGARYQELLPGQGLPNAQIPVNPRLPAQYRYIVSVTWREHVTGELSTTTIQVLSSTRLTSGDVQYDAEESSKASSGGSGRPSGRVGAWAIVSQDTEILYAERRS